MSFYPDLGTRTMVASGPYVRAAGWLHRDHPYPQGPVPAAFVARLQQFAAGCSQSTQALGWGMFCGLHGCEFCGGVYAGGNFGVPSGEVLYVAPEMVAHYVQAHAYAPPAAFIAAVLASPLPGTEEYGEALERFRRLQPE
jgi:hypothetical protein